MVTKRRVSAFAGSDLEVVLRSGEVGHLVLCGIATSGVVLSTLREAADRDYRLTVLSDLCVDPDPEVQRVLLEKPLVAMQLTAGLIVSLLFCGLPFFRFATPPVQLRCVPDGENTAPITDAQPVDRALAA